MSICRAWLHNTSNALTFGMSGKQICFNSRLNCLESTAGSCRWSGSQFQTVGSLTENARVSKMLWWTRDRRQTMLVFPGPCDQTCCSIVNMLQLVHDNLLRRGRQNRVTIVDAQCDKGVDQCLYRLNIQRAMNTSQLPKPEETAVVAVVIFY